ncbi:MAG: XamI family restriction endonuclease [Dehalococcoidia bacterium]
MADRRALPQTWTRDQLTLIPDRSIDAFISWFQEKGNTSHRNHYATAVESVERLLSISNDLRNLSKDTLLRGEKSIREAARYVAGPPLSSDDLKILARMKRLWEPDRLQDLVDVIVSARDPLRFPWLFETPPRAPLAEERRLAVAWTAGLLAAQKASTERRGESSKRQEAAVDAVLSSIGFKKESARAIRSIRDLETGTYCRQSMVSSTRADLSVGLWDGRLLLLECKVSNSEVNSYKRLNAEVGRKETVWRNEFGNQAVTGAVLAGAFSLENLASAQTNGIYLFWEADLGSLVSFVGSTK